MQTIQSMLRVAAVSLGLAMAAQMPAYAADPLPEPSAQQPQAAVKDSTITAKVKEVLAANKLNNISVKTDLGVVYLSGTIANESDRQLITQMVASVEGVKIVESKALKVKAS